MQLAACSRQRIYDFGFRISDWEEQRAEGIGKDQTTRGNGDSATRRERQRALVSCAQSIASKAWSNEYMEQIGLLYAVCPMLTSWLLAPDSWIL